MENNQLPKIDNKLLVKKILVNTAASAAFGLFLAFIAYGGRIPIKPALIAIGILIVVLPMSMFLAARYRNYITPDKNKIRKLFLVLGILTVIVNLVLIIIEGGRIDYYLGVILGLYFISGPNIYKPKPQKLIEK